jgi:hypothetical protein
VPAADAAPSDTRRRIDDDSTPLVGVSCAR